MKHVIVGTAGHIDHGKTALVLALTGIDADRLKEEKQRGITIDIGFADLAIGDVRLGFVDVPGHERFVKNMLAGAHGLDMVMLVVSADESIMPQTREHFDICRLLNVKSGLVALTKSDLVDEELLELARAEVEDFVRDSFLDGAPIVPVSSRTGAGIEELKQELLKLAESTNPKSLDAIPRLPVDRAFSVKGFGTVVTGTLIAGELSVGDEIQVFPSGPKARIRNLQVHGKDTEQALAGQRTAVNLQGVDVSQVPRGTVIAPAGRVSSTSLLDARLNLLPSANRPLSQRARVRLHHGTAEIMARVVILEGDILEDDARPGEGPGTAGDFTDADMKPAKKIEPGASGLVQFRLETPVTALPGDRFIIRSYSPQVTIGGGTIIDALPQKHRVRSPAPRVLEKLERADAVERVAILLEMAGSSGLTLGEIVCRTGATDAQMANARAVLVDTSRAADVPGSSPALIASTAVHEICDRVVSFLEEHHRSEPLSLGPSREEVRDRFFNGVRAEVFRTIIQRLVDSGTVAAERDALRMASHRPALGEAEAEAKRKFEDSLNSAGLKAGTIEETAAAAGVPIDLARKLYTLMAAERRVQKLGDLVFLTDALDQLKSAVKARKAVNPKMDVAVFKELTGGLSRKHAIPLLEYLDRERVTRRVGNEREIL
ncbi:MAG TPA: selenocysteine-specific translation elongation factor [Blastocatellia bacterium]|nr:selenocysteine-specific translation elongation factor [Blastocatellia bacterium]